MPSGITLDHAIRVFGREMGCYGAELGTQGREDIVDAIQNGIEYMLLNGGGDILREWVIPVTDSIFTFPRDLETPIKYKFGDSAKNGFGTFFSGYYSYTSQGVQDCTPYSEWNTNNFSTLVNTVPTQNQPPCCGVRLIATTRDPKDVGKKIMVAGKLRGMDIAPLHNGVKTEGEMLTIYLESDPNKRYSSYFFEQITSVVKEPTCSYVMLSGVDTRTDPCQYYFLSHYHPDEETPQYVQARISNGCCMNFCRCFYIHVLGRISSSIRYVRGDDILPITSTEILKLLAKRARYDLSGNYNEVAVMEQRLRNVIRQQVAYQQKANRSISVRLSSSGASLSNV